MRTKDDFRFVIRTRNNGEKRVYVQKRGLLWGWNYIREQVVYHGDALTRGTRIVFRSLRGAESWLESLLGDQVNEESTTYFYPSSQKFSKT